MSSTLALDRTLPVTGASVVTLVHGRGIVLRDPDGELLDVLFAMPECGTKLTGAWRGDRPRWGLAAGQAPPDEPVEVAFLRRRRATQFLTTTPARVHRVGELWVAEAAGDYAAAMLSTPGGVHARRLQHI